MIIEKLEQEIESLENSFEQFAIVDDEIAMVHTATIAGLKMAINIVKQHQAESWVSVSERLPNPELHKGFDFAPSSFYQIIDNKGNYETAYFSKQCFDGIHESVFVVCNLKLKDNSYYAYDFYCELQPHQVKFWRPLPQPPKQ